MDLWRRCKQHHAPRGGSSPMRISVRARIRGPAFCHFNCRKSRARRTSRYRLPTVSSTAPNLRPVAVLEQGTAALPGLIKLSGPVTLDGRPVETGTTAS